MLVAADRHLSALDRPPHLDHQRLIVEGRSTALCLMGIIIGIIGITRKEAVLWVGTQQIKKGADRLIRTPQMLLASAYSLVSVQVTSPDSDSP